MKLTKKELRKIKDTLKKISNSAETLLFFYANSGDLNVETMSGIFVLTADEEMMEIRKELARLTRFTNQLTLRQFETKGIKIDTSLAARLTERGYCRRCVENFTAEQYPF